MTTYASWRYVFVAETVVMVIVLFAARLIHDVDRDPDVRIDPLSVLASAGGLALIVYGGAAVEDLGMAEAAASAGDQRIGDRPPAGRVAGRLPVADRRRRALVVRRSPTRACPFRPAAPYCA